MLVSELFGFAVRFSVQAYTHTYLFCCLVVQDHDWTDYWRLLFKKVTVDDITVFEKSYKGSEEEVETLRSAYVDCEGDMERILEEVPECVCVCVCVSE